MALVCKVVSWYISTHGGKTKHSTRDEVSDIRLAQVWGYLTAFNKVNLVCSFFLAAAYLFLIRGPDKKISHGFASAERWHN